MKLSKNLGNKIPSGTYWRVHLVCIKVQVNSSLEPPLEYNKNPMLVMKSVKVSCEIFNKLGTYKTIMQFQISFRREKK